MTLRRRLSLAASLALVALATPVSLWAQAAAPTPPPAPAAALPVPAGGLTGPLVPGVCLLSREDLIGRSKVGQAVTVRLRDLAQEAQSALEAEKARLEARGKALQEKRPTLTEAQFQTQALALQRRAQTLQTDVTDRSRQMDATRNGAYGQLIAEAQPFIASAFAAHGCGLLFNRDAALGGNFGNDLTPEVLAAFDAKGAPITVTLAPAGAK